jgi:hypothetical protein
MITLRGVPRPAKVPERGFRLSDSALFISGSWFTTDYVDQAIKAAPAAYLAVDVTALRAKLDALYFILYGVFDPANAAASLDDVRHIYSTFPIVAEKETEKWGSYKSEELCLAWINALMAGQPDAEIEV